MAQPIEVYTVPPTPGQPLAQAQAGYVDHGPYSCKNCSWFERPESGGEVGACKPVGGAVHRDACCDYWNDDGAPEHAGKAGCEYVYVPGANYTCSECVYFDQVFRDNCWPVLGRIAPGGSCNKWTP